MLKPEYIFLWILFHLFAVELPKNLANRSKPQTPAFEQVKHMRFQKALETYNNLNDVKLAVEYKAIATALSKLNNPDSALAVYSKMSIKFPNSIQNKELLEIAYLKRKIGDYHYSDSLIAMLKAGEYSFTNVYDDFADTNFHKRYKVLDYYANNKKTLQFTSNSDHYGAVKNPKTNAWYFHAKDSIYDGLLHGVSNSDKKFFEQIYEAKGWNDSVIQKGDLLQDKVINKYVELSHIDSFGNYYVTMNNRFVNDSDQFLLQTYRYFFDHKTSKFVFEGLGLEQYFYNVSSFALNASRTKGLFCSDMSGTIGKSDIWICDVSFDNKGEIHITNPTNLGAKVNTIWSESDPTFVTDQIIAFASEGRLGFGGYDIYYYSIPNNEVANAGKIVNSTDDEFFPKYYDSTLTYSQNGKNSKISIKTVNINLDKIEESVQTILPPPPVEIPVEAPPVIAEKTNTEIIQSTLDKVKRESVNKYDYARNLSFVLLSDSERLEIISKIDSTSNYKDFKFMTLFHVDNEFVIEKDFEKELEIMAALLNKRPDWGMEIRSYTDSRGSKLKNQKLSQSRADYVAKYLEQKGVNAKQILPIGYGESMLINHCADGVPCTEEEHRQNRRTELIISPVVFWSKKEKSNNSKL